MSENKQKIAVIGSGISGMAAAWLLDKHYDVTLFEKNDYVGGHARTKVVEHGDRTIAVDTGFIVFNYRNYPNLNGLFEALDVPVQPTNMSFAATIEGGKMEWGAKDLNSVFGQRKNLLKPSFYRMIADILKFNKRSLEVLDRNALITLGQLLDELKVGDWFLNYYLLPMGGAIWSCSPKMMLDFPAQTFVRFFNNHGLLSINDQPTWYTVTGGSKVYVEKLVKSLKGEVKTSCGIKKVSRDGMGVTIQDDSYKMHRFDQVVLACHADEALAMLEDPTEDEKKVLGSFTYQRNDAYLHCDTSQMPKEKRCWANWVYMSEGSFDEAEISVSYWMNGLQSIDENYLLIETLNPITDIDDSKIFDEHVFTHPVFTKKAIVAQEKIPSLQGVGNTWYCGAYQRYGFHEDGIQSAVKVAKALEATIPWE